MADFTLAFSDFWHGFDPRNNPLLHGLQARHSVRLVRRDPDYLIYSCFGSRHYTLASPSTVKIYFTGENVAPDFAACDYAISAERLEFGDRHQRYPQYMFMVHDAEALRDRPTITRQHLDARLHFCNFIYSNPHAAPERDRFLRMLHAARPVISAGRHLRNHTRIDRLYTEGTPREKKLRFMRDFRFTIAFENSSHPGYVTEKLLEALLARTVPIYWGDRHVTDDFNPDSFVNAHDYPDFDALIEAVLALDADPDRMLAMLNAPALRDTGTSPESYRKRLNDFFDHIVTQPRAAARRHPRFGWNRNVVKSRQRFARFALPWIGFSRM